MELAKRVLAHAMRRELSKLDAMYQRHMGEECYLFGDGVSLKWMDLTRFKDRISILGNMMLYHTEAQELRALYCAIVEPFYFWPVFPYGGWRNFRYMRNHGYQEYLKSMAEHTGMTFFVNLSNYPVVRHLNSVFVTRWHVPVGPECNAFQERRDAHNGTLNFQIALAAYMGFKRAFLVGHDYTHSPARSLHFYEKGEGVITGEMNHAVDFLGFAKRDIDLITVTLDGRSSTLPSITYAELTGSQPTFRENVELVSMAKLESLAKWPLYQIF